jgi:hypothetical protein
MSRRITGSRYAWCGLLGSYLEGYEDLRIDDGLLHSGFRSLGLFLCRESDFLGRDIMDWTFGSHLDVSLSIRGPRYGYEHENNG